MFFGNSKNRNTPSLEMGLQQSSMVKIGNLYVREEESAYSPIKLGKKTSTLLGRSGLPVNKYEHQSSIVSEQKFKPQDLGSPWRKSFAQRR